MQELERYICEECGTIYTADDVLEQYGDNAFTEEHIDNSYDEPFIAITHNCPCCGAEQMEYIGPDDEAIERNHREYMEDREMLMREWRRGLL